MFLPNGDIDNIAGLLVLREMQPFTFCATEPRWPHVAAACSPWSTPTSAARRAVKLDERSTPALGFTVTPFAVPGKIPLYMERGREADLALGVEGETTLGLEISRTGARRLLHP